MIENKTIREELLEKYINKSYCEVQTELVKLRDKLENKQISKQEYNKKHLMLVSNISYFKQMLLLLNTDNPELIMESFLK